MTIAELIVSMVIIGIILGLLLPAVQTAREAAQRITCSNHSRQVALGVLDYELSRVKFPSNEGLMWTQKIAFQTGESEYNTLAWADASEQEQKRLLNIFPRLYSCPSARIKSVEDHPSLLYGISLRLLGSMLSEILD